MRRIIPVIAVALVMLIAGQAFAFKYVSGNRVYKDAKIIIVKNKASNDDLNKRVNEEAGKFKYCEILGFDDASVVMVCSNSAPVSLDWLSPTVK